MLLYHLLNVQPRIAFRVQTATGSSPAEEAAVDSVQLWQALLNRTDSVDC